MSPENMRNTVTSDEENPNMSEVNENESESGEVDENEQNSDNEAQESKSVEDSLVDLEEARRAYVDKELEYSKFERLKDLLSTDESNENVIKEEMEEVREDYKKKQKEYFVAKIDEEYNGELTEKQMQEITRAVHITEFAEIDKMRTEVKAQKFKERYGEKAANAVDFLKEKGGEILKDYKEASVMKKIGIGVGLMGITTVGTATGVAWASGVGAVGIAGMRGLSVASAYNGFRDVFNSEKKIEDFRNKNQNTSMINASSEVLNDERKEISEVRKRAEAFKKNLEKDIGEMNQKIYKEHDIDATEKVKAMASTITVLSATHAAVNLAIEGLGELYDKYTNEPVKIDEQVIENVNISMTENDNVITNTQVIKDMNVSKMEDKTVAVNAQVIEENTSEIDNNATTSNKEQFSVFSKEYLDEIVGEERVDDAIELYEGTKEVTGDFIESAVDYMQNVGDDISEYAKEVVDDFNSPEVPGTDSVEYNSSNILHSKLNEIFNSQDAINYTNQDVIYTGTEESEPFTYEQVLRYQNIVNQFVGDKSLGIQNPYDNQTLSGYLTECAEKLKEQYPNDYQKRLNEILEKSVENKSDYIHRDVEVQTSSGETIKGNLVDYDTINKSSNALEEGVTNPTTTISYGSERVVMPFTEYAKAENIMNDCMALLTTNDIHDNRAIKLVPISSILDGTHVQISSFKDGAVERLKEMVEGIQDKLGDAGKVKDGEPINSYFTRVIAENYKLNSGNGNHLEILKEVFGLNAEDMEKFTIKNEGGGTIHKSPNYKNNNW